MGQWTKATFVPFSRIMDGFYREVLQFATVQNFDQAVVKKYLLPKCTSETYEGLVVLFLFKDDLLVVVFLIVVAVFLFLVVFILG